MKGKIKTNEAPEKIYLPVNPDTGSPCYRLTGPKDNYIGSVEYTRTDAFIKKAEKWIKDNGYMYNGECEGDVNAMAEHFVNCMKGE